MDTIDNPIINEILSYELGYRTEIELIDRISDIIMNDQEKINYNIRPLLKVLNENITIDTTALKLMFS